MSSRILAIYCSLTLVSTLALSCASMSPADDSPYQFEQPTYEVDDDAGGEGLGELFG